MWSGACMIVFKARLHLVLSKSIKEIIHIFQVAGFGEVGKLEQVWRECFSGVEIDVGILKTSKSL